MWIDFRHKFHSTYLMLLTVARVLVCGFPFPCDKILAREISRSGDPSRDVVDLEMLCLRFGKECGFGSLKPSCGSHDRWIVRPWRVLQQQDPPGLVRPDSELFWNCRGFLYFYWVFEHFMLSSSYCMLTPNTTIGILCNRNDCKNIDQPLPVWQTESLDYHTELSANSVGWVVGGVIRIDAKM